MTLKEKFLSINNYEEYKEKREEFKGLKMDKEILEHAGKIFPKVSDTKEELFKLPKREK